MKLLTTILPSLFLYTASFAQVAEQWKFDLPTDGKNKILQQMIQSKTKDLVLVGTTYSPKAEQDGFIAFIDPERGTLSHQQQLFGVGNGKDDVIESVVQLEDNGYYLLGTTSAKKQPTTSWLIRTDELGRPLGEKIHVEFGRLHKMVLFDDNSLFLLGKKQDEDERLWVVRFAEGIVQDQYFFLEGKWKELTLKGVTPTYSDEVLLCGSGLKDRARITWIAKLSKTENSNNSDKILVNFAEREDLPDLQFARAAFDRSLILTGGQYLGKPWMAEVDDQQNPFVSDIPFEKVQRGEGAIRNYADQHLLVTQTYYDRDFFLNYLRAYEPVTDFKAKLNKGPYELRALHYSFDRQYILAATVYENKLKAIRLQSFKDEENLVSVKASPKVRITGLRLSDANRDGVLSPGERAGIVFYLHNDQKEPLYETKVLLKSNVTNVRFAEQTAVGYIPPSQRMKVSIGFNADANLVKNKVIPLTLIIMEKGQEIESYPLDVPTEKTEVATSPASLNIYWDEIGERNIRSEEPTTTVKIRIQSEKQLLNQDVRAVVNGIVLDNSKDAGQPIQRNEFSGFSTLSIDVPLKEGNNEIYVEVKQNGQVVRTKPLTISFEPSKPNLHVLAIGPKYSDLKYNGKDALDFAKIMEDQEDRGLFNRVFIRTYTSAEETTKRAISIAFSDLLKRFTEKDGADKIAKNDVLMVFISSHGEMTGKRFQIIPSDYDRNYPTETGLDYKDKVIHYLDLINCKKFVFLDACHSGGASKSVGKLGISRALLELNKSMDGLSSITSCGRDELSYEHENWENGAFTEALIEAFSGKTITLDDGTTFSSDQSKENDGDGLLSLEELFNYLEVRVPILVESINKSGQTPHKKFDEALPKDLNFFILEQN